MNRILLIISLVTLIISCRRNEEEVQNPTTTVKAYAFDETNDDTLTSVTFHISRRATSQSGSVTPVGTYTANSEGMTEFTFSYESGYHYYLSASSGNLLLYQYVIIQPGQANNLLVTMHHPGFIQLHIQNTSPFNNSDQMILRDSDYYQYEHFFNGISVDTTLLIAQYGNVPANLKWFVTKNDTTISYNQAVTSVADDTLFIDLFY